jgi:hypothetical protein
VDDVTAIVGAPLPVQPQVNATTSPTTVIRSAAKDLAVIRDAMPRVRSVPDPSQYLKVTFMGTG